MGQTTKEQKKKEKQLQLKKQVCATRKTQLRPCSVGTMFCWDHVLLGPLENNRKNLFLKIAFFQKKIKIKKNVFENFLSLSLLRCGPDNKRTK